MRIFQPSTDDQHRMFTW